MRAAARIALALLAVSATAAAAERTGYEALANWDYLPAAKTGVVAGLISSYDRSGANQDYNHYEYPTGLRTDDVDTILTPVHGQGQTTHLGPGVVTRFWMPHAAAEVPFPVKITIDGAAVPQIDTDSDTLLGGAYGQPPNPATDLFSGPLVGTLVGGQVSYEPISFQQSLKIESYNYSGGSWARTHHYYQYNYYRFENGDSVASFTGTMTPAQQTARAAAVSIIDNAGANPAGADPGAVVIGQPAQSIPAGGSLTLAGIAGSGRIRRLSLRMDSADDDELDGLRLRVSYDGLAGHAIDVPVSHFFGAGHERVAYSSVPMGTDGAEGFYCYLPMPFRRSVAVELYNDTGSPISIDSATVEYTAGGVGADDGYLHAAFNEQTLSGEEPFHLLLQTAGQGHYVGNLLYVQRAETARAILEGDDIIIIDGNRYLYGTGLEDAFNAGYYYNHVLAQAGDGDDPYPESGTGPYHGLLHMDDQDFGDGFLRTDQYRWLIADAVPFTDSIEVRVEHFSDPTHADALFGSTAFYYLIPDPPHPGDINFDGLVDGLDYTAWANHYQMTGLAWSDGDLNDDGIPDGLDYIIWSNNYGYPPGAPLPEPAGLVLLAAGGAVLLRRRP